MNKPESPRLKLPLQRHYLNASVYLVLAVPPMHVASCGAGGLLTNGIQESRKSITMGQTSVDLVTREWPGDHLLFVVLHDNENTASDAASRILRERGGRLVELSHTGERNLTFGLSGTTYAVDPNRIFTESGLEKTLREQSKYAPAAATEARNLARAILSALKPDPEQTLVAVHNNRGGDYSAQSYIQGGELEKDAAAVHLASAHDPHDFFFVTERSDFDTLVRLGYNVVLQDKRRVTDDGSLSVYCSSHGIPYINVEAEQNHLAEQMAMLQALADMLASKKRVGGKGGQFEKES